MKIILLILVIFSSLTQTSYAVNVNEINSDLQNSIGIDRVLHSLPDSVDEMLEPFDVYSGDGLNNVLSVISNHIFKAIQSQIKMLYKPVVQTFIVMLLCNIFSLLVSEKNRTFPIQMIGSTAIILLNLNETKSLFSDCIGVINSLYDFSTVLLPCLAGASVFAGATVSAGVKYTAAALFMNVLLNFSNTVLVPIVSVYLVCMIGDSVFKQPLLGAVSSVIHKLCITALTGSVVLFTTYLNIAGLVSGAGELLSTRIARTTISVGLPIVGKIISDTASTLVAGATVLRNGVGVLGMLALIAMMIIPVVSIGIRYLLFKCLGQSCTFFPERHFTGLIKGISEVYGMMLAMIGSGFVMLFLTVLSFTHMVGI